MARYQPIRYGDFSSGMQTKTMNSLMLDSEVQLARNVDLDEVGSLKKRKGYSILGGIISTGTAMIGNHYFNSTTDTNDRHIAAINEGGSAGIFYYDTGSWAVHLGNQTAGEKIRFDDFVDRTFECNGAEPMKSWDGNPANAFDSTSCGSAPACKYIRVFQDRIYLANESSGTVNRSRVYYSSVPDTGSVSFVIGTSYIDFNPEDGQTITALDENSGRLLVFKDDSMFRWNGLSTEPDPIIDVGTTSQESVKTIHGITYFFNRYGVYSYDGGMPVLISRKVQEWTDAIDQTTLADINAEVDNDHYYLSVGDVTVGGEDYTNVTLVYNIPLKAWTVWTTEDKVSFLAHYYSGGARLVSFGSGSGQVHRINDGNSDNGAAIDVNINTKQYDLGMPEENKTFTEVYIGSKNARGMVEIGANLDNDSIKTIGSLDENITRLPSSLVGRKLGISLSESGTGNQWSLESIIFKDVEGEGSR